VAEAAAVVAVEAAVVAVVVAAAAAVEAEAEAAAVGNSMLSPVVANPLGFSALNVRQASTRYRPVVLLTDNLRAGTPARHRTTMFVRRRLRR
jgi:hypothetical protein